MPNIVQNYNETTNDPEYPLTYEEAILDPDGNPIKGYVKEAVVAPQYDPTTGTYAVGDPVMDDKKYYRCNTAVASPEDFDPTKWTEKTISEEIDGLNQSLAELDTKYANIKTSISDGRFFGCKPPGVSLFYVVIPYERKPSNVSLSGFKIFHASTWKDLTTAETGYANGVLTLGFSLPSGVTVTDGTNYWVRGSITCTYSS